MRHEYQKTIIGPELREVEERQALIDSITHISHAMLEKAVQHTDTWRRAQFGISPRKTESFFEALSNNNLLELFMEHKDSYTGNTYPVDTPGGAYIQVQEFTSQSLADGKKKSYAELEIGLIYEAPNKEQNYLVTEYHVGTDRATNYVLSTEYMETGYDGHDMHNVILSNKQLEGIATQLNEYKPVHIPERPMNEQMAEIKLVNEQTGQELFYDDEVKDWVPEGGADELFGDTSELNEKNPNKEVLDIKATFAIKPAEKKNVRKTIL